MIEHADFKENNKYFGKFKIAAFIPFLDSKEYADDPRLPKDTHECNYAGKSALIFQELPYQFKIYFNSRYEKKNYNVVPILNIEK